MVQGESPDVSSIILRLDPVVDLISLETKAAMTATSLLVLNLKLWENLAYLDSISVFAELRLHASTCSNNSLFVLGSPKLT